MWILALRLTSEANKPIMARRTLFNTRGAEKREREHDVLVECEQCAESNLGAPLFVPRSRLPLASWPSLPSKHVLYCHVVVLF